MKKLLIVMCLGLQAVGTHAAPRKAQFENAFEYQWSRSAEMVIYATISSVQVVDDPTQPSSYIGVALRVDSLQRGATGDGNVEVRIDETLFYSEEEIEVGKHGLWFLHRVRRPPGKNPQTSLIRYMNSSEISRDLAYTDELMQFVIQDTVDQSIKTDILRDLEPANRLKERHVELKLEYDGKGGLTEAFVDVPSGNSLFDSHVLETVVFMHRNLVYPDVLRKASIQITRQPRPLKSK